MQEYVCFEGAVQPMPWGDKVYTVLPLPDEVVQALGKTKRVEGEIAETPVNLALTKAPIIDQTFVYTGKTLLAEVGIAPGDVVEVRLRPAPDADVEVPTDVIAAVRAAGRLERWEALTPGKQRGLLHQINTAKRAETRAKRIAKMVADL